MAAALLSAGQASLRDALCFWRRLPCAKATRLLSGHRYAMMTRGQMSRRLDKDTLTFGVKAVKRRILSYTPALMELPGNAGQDDLKKVYK